MKQERDFASIDLVLENKERAVCSGGVNSALIGCRDLSEDTYRIPGLPFLVTRGEFGALLFGRFGSRLGRRDRYILDKLVRDIDEGQLGSGFQHLPLQGSDEGVGIRRPVLQCFIDRENLTGSPSVSWFIVAIGMIDYFESVARPAGRILIDG